MDFIVKYVAKINIDFYLNILLWAFSILKIPVLVQEEVFIIGFNFY